MSTVLRLLWAVVLLAGAFGTVLFFVQGGFAGGHGKFDGVLVLLGCPWSLLPLPWPEVVDRHDFLWLVAFPFAVNVVLLGILTALRLKGLAVR